MPLILYREKGESWRDAALRQAGKFGLQEDVAHSFDAEKAVTESEQAEAAFYACYEWDVLDFEDRR